MTKTTAFTLSVTLALTVATPTITPNGGNFSGSVSVAMQTATSGASIYYTTDGSTPTQSSILYTGAMTLTSSATVNAKAFKSGYNPSAMASASFINTGTGKTYYVAKTGSDSNSCAQAQNQALPSSPLTEVSHVSPLAIRSKFEAEHIMKASTRNESRIEPETVAELHQPTTIKLVRRRAYPLPQVARYLCATIHPGSTKHLTVLMVTDECHRQRIYSRMEQ